MITTKKIFLCEENIGNEWRTIRVVMESQQPVQLSLMSGRETPLLATLSEYMALSAARYDGEVCTYG